MSAPFSMIIYKTTITHILKIPHPDKSGIWNGTAKCCSI